MTVTISKPSRHRRGMPDLRLSHHAMQNFYFTYSSPHIELQDAPSFRTGHFAVAATLYFAGQQSAISVLVTAMPSPLAGLAPRRVLPIDVAQPRSAS